MNISGKTVEGMKVNTKTIKSMGMAFILGQTIEYIKDGGIKVNSMV